MRLKIHMARDNEGRYSASVGDHDYFDITCIADCATPKAACKSAAKALREAADRFDLLAQEDSPSDSKTLTRINRAKLVKLKKVDGNNCGWLRAPGGSTNGAF